MSHRDDVRLCGTMVDVDSESGLATGIRRICLSEKEAIEFANTQNASS